MQTNSACSVLSTNPHSTSPGLSLHISPTPRLDSRHPTLTRRLPGSVRFRQTLKLRIISGAYIPKPAGSSLDDIIDPYVNVYVTGHPADEDKLKTQVVKNNGTPPRGL